MSVRRIVNPGWHPPGTTLYVHNDKEYLYVIKKPNGLYVVGDGKYQRADLHSLMDVLKAAEWDTDIPPGGDNDSQKEATQAGVGDT